MSDDPKMKLTAKKNCPECAAAEPEKSCEQQARDMLERMGVPDAQSYSAGELVELANLINASPSAQPIARDEQDAKRYRWLREFWIWADNVDAEGHPREKVAISGARTDGLDKIIDTALKSAGKDNG